MFTRETVSKFKESLKLIKNRADIIISISENTKKDIIKLLNVPEERIKVIPIAANKQYRPLKNIELIKDLKKGTA